MEKVMIIAYDFPPVSGSGVQRTTKFVKYLGQFGYTPHIYSRTAIGAGLKDTSLFDEIKDIGKAYRTDPLNPSLWKGPLGLFGKIIKRFLVPDEAFLWYLFNRNKVLKIVKDEQIKLIYTTSYPYSDHLFALYLKKKIKGLKWVADFRDEWNNNPYIMEKQYTRFRKNKEWSIEQEIITKCDHYIINTKEMLDNSIRDFKNIAGKNSFIPNGFDYDDFKGLDRAFPANSKFTITYSGLMYGIRKPDAFLQAIKELIESKDIDGARLNIRFIGNYKPADVDEKIAIYGLQGIMEVIPYMKHKESIKKVLESDLLLLIESVFTMHTGKAVEYIYMNRPILGIVPKGGAASNLLRDTRTGVTCENISEIKIALKQYYDAWVNHQTVFEPNSQEIDRYSRYNLTKNLAAIFDGLVKQ